ncbi:choice-of-anchor D domain-containing protein [Hyunsoonleella flava]|uniref:Choice-of-anchor D domain-containing protein n=1 Tax=Hyunsoonleella flava TaxID=2527939 RepID=A0A4Q9FGQ6_9FLAO|nr:choice-of-anchor D domain-containing protein [Hyunsoonleella flava]TBN04354.1 choice-of-anchor D domain-containing protein [Hyunsoonleella flava]
MKKILFSTLFILLFTCNSNIEPLDPSFFIKEPAPDEVKISIEGLNDIDYTEVTAITIDSTVTISSDGIFKNPYSPNGVEDLPVLLLENDEILMGYFPHTLKSNKAGIDDIILFYFLTYPELAIQGYDYEFVLKEIKTSDEYLKLKGLVVSDLNSNKSPLINDEFNAMVRSITIDIKEAHDEETSKTKKENASYKFNFDREGKVSWENQFPLYAAVGISIQNTTTFEYLLEPKLLETKSLVFSPVSFVSWAFNEVFTDNNDVKVESATFNKDGYYKISISNGNLVGNADDPLYDYVRARNKLFVSANLLGYIIPISSKTIKSNSKCLNSFIKLQDEINLYVTKLIFKQSVPNSGELIGDIINLGSNTDEIFVACYSGTASRYLKILTDGFAKRLSTLEDVSTLALMLRDFMGSKIYLEEQRNYSKGLSFGNLKGKDESELEFEGEPEESFNYFKTFEELEVSYDITRNVISSTVKQQDKWIKAVNLSFLPEVKTGDADISQNAYDNKGHINTNTEGKIEVKLVMGEKPSEVIIKPTFDYETIKEASVKLEPNKSIGLSGNLDFGEVKINTGKGQTFVIENKSAEVMTISSIDLPEGFSTPWQLQPINPFDSESILLVFEPIEVKDYTGTITVNNNIDNVNNQIEVIGFGTDDKITLEGNLDFGDVLINPETPPTRVLTISNHNLNKSINVNPIVLPDGFTATGWVNGGVLNPSVQQQIVITFNPTEVKTYDSVLVINNDVDDVNNKIDLKGTGINDQVNIEGVWFGETNVTKCEPARFDTVTPNCEMHTVLNERDVEFLSGFSGFCDAGLECGTVVFNFYTNSESIYRNKYEFDGTTLSIDVRTNSSGNFFNGRVFKYTGTINATGDKFEGTYTMDMPGGIWGAYTEGTMTFTKK